MLSLIVVYKKNYKLTDQTEIKTYMNINNPKNL